MLAVDFELPSCGASEHGIKDNTVAPRAALTIGHRCSPRVTFRNSVWILFSGFSSRGSIAFRIEEKNFSICGLAIHVPWLEAADPIDGGEFVFPVFFDLGLFGRPMFAMDRRNRVYGASNGPKAIFERVQSVCLRVHPSSSSISVKYFSTASVAS